MVVIIEEISEVPAPVSQQTQEEQQHPVSAQEADTPGSTEEWVQVDHDDAAPKDDPDHSHPKEDEVEEEVEDPAVVLEKLGRSEAIKAEGNRLFAEGQMQKALEKYSAALEAAPAASSAAPQRAIYLCNRAACHMHLDNPTAAAQDCSAAIEGNPGYVKAHLRRSAAYEALDDLERALADAQKSKELDPGSKAAGEVVARLEPLVVERREQMKEEMMGKLKDLGNTVLGKFGLSLDNFKAEKDPATGSYSIKFG